IHIVIGCASSLIRCSLLHSNSFVFFEQLLILADSFWQAWIVVDSPKHVLNLATQHIPDDVGGHMTEFAVDTICLVKLQHFGPRWIVDLAWTQFLQRQR